MDTRRPVVLQVLPALDVGGVEHGTVEIAAAISQAGGTALVACGTGPLLPRLRYVGGRYCPFTLDKTLSPFVIMRRARALRKLIREHKVDLVHARSRVPAWVAWLACQRERVPLVTTWHGVHEARSGLKRYYNSVLARGERVIAVSHYIAQRLENEHNVGAGKLRLIPRGADPERFDPGHISGVRVQALEEQWNVPENAKVILMPSRLTPWKGQRILVDAMARLQKTCPEPWICVLAGPQIDEKFARRLLDRAKALGVEDRLRFTGICEDMPAAYTIASVVVAPSLRPEPFGRIVVEAQMMGCPVIGTALGGMMETILPNETGLVVPPADPDRLAEALALVLEADEESLSCLSEKARDHVLSHYTTQQMQSATLGVYDELLGTTLREAFDGTVHDR